jgi:hypothetical protein
MIGFGYLKLNKPPPKMQEHKKQERLIYQHPDVNFYL